MNRPRRGPSLFSILFILIVASLLWWQRQNIVDWWRLRGYSAPASISNLASEDTMTPYARHIFYVNHPQLLTDVNSFHKECPQSEKTIVLGCYHSNQLGIGIYKIQDQRLDGVEEVTAGHEMLHAAYDRLSKPERNKVNSELQDFFNNDLHDERIKDTINTYRLTEPGQEINEMHSILGTEVSSLSPQLEAYYKKYFYNRSSVTTFADKYEEEFNSRTSRINDYDKQLAGLKQQIEDEENSLDSQLNQLQEDRQKIDTLRSSGRLAEYNAAVPSFNSEVNQYNLAVAKLKEDISNYNDLVTARNAVASELRGLSNSLDTRLTTQSSQ